MGGSLKRGTRFRGHKLGDGSLPNGLFVRFWAGKNQKNFKKFYFFLDVRLQM